MKKEPLTEAQKEYNKSLSKLRLKWRDIINEDEVMEKLNITKAKLAKMRKEGFIKRFASVSSVSDGKKHDIIYSVSELVNLFYPKGKVSMYASIAWDDLVTEKEVMAKTGLSKKKLREKWHKHHEISRVGYADARNYIYSKTELSEVLFLFKWIDEIRGNDEYNRRYEKVYPKPLLKPKGR